MAAGSLFAFWLVSLLLVVVPGADWAFTINAGLRGRSVLPAVGGLVTGYAVVTVVVAAGVGALVAGSPAMLTGLTLAGGAYLIWHGGTTLARPATPAAAAGPAAGGGWQIFRTGIGVSGLNPKGLLIFLALLPQFTDPAGRWPMAVQIGVLGVAFLLTCAVFYSAVGGLTRAMLLRRPTVARTVSRVSGVAMVLIGALLLIERLLGG